MLPKFSNSNKLDKNANWWPNCISHASRIASRKHGQPLDAAKTAREFAPYWSAASSSPNMRDQCSTALRQYSRGPYLQPFPPSPRKLKPKYKQFPPFPELRPTFYQPQLYQQRLSPQYEQQQMLQTYLQQPYQPPQLPQSPQSFEYRPMPQPRFAQVLPQALPKPPPLPPVYTPYIYPKRVISPRPPPAPPLPPVYTPYIYPKRVINPLNVYFQEIPSDIIPKELPPPLMYSSRYVRYLENFKKLSDTFINGIREIQEVNLEWKKMLLLEQQRLSQVQGKEREVAKVEDYYTTIRQRVLQWKDEQEIMLEKLVHDMENLNAKELDERQREEKQRLPVPLLVPLPVPQIKLPEVSVTPLASLPVPKPKVFSVPIGPIAFQTSLEKERYSQYLMQHKKLTDMIINKHKEIHQTNVNPTSFEQDQLNSLIQQRNELDEDEMLAREIENQSQEEGELDEEFLRQLDFQKESLR